MFDSIKSLIGFDQVNNEVDIGTASIKIIEIVKSLKAKIKKLWHLKQPHLKGQPFRQILKIAKKKQLNY